MTIKFGPSGLGGVKEAISVLQEYHRLGFKACEIAFTYGAYIKKQEDAKAIGKEAKKLDIELSIHAHYWINLNSKEEEKVKKSKERILECCKVGTWLGAHRVVFHPGYYAGKDKEETYQKIKEEMIDLQKTIKEKKYTPKLAPETTGKVNVFGSIDEISRLVSDTGCDFCIDFSHILAREKDYKFEEVFEAFSKHKEFHVHFSGIEYGEKGERKHLRTPEKELKKLISNMPKNKQIRVISESPNPVEDSLLGMEVYLK